MTREKIEKEGKGNTVEKADEDSDALPTFTVDAEGEVKREVKENDIEKAEEWYPTFELDSEGVKQEPLFADDATAHPEDASVIFDEEEEVIIDESDLFEDQLAYDAAPFISVRSESKSLKYRKITVLLSLAFPGMHFHLSLKVLSVEFF